MVEGGKEICEELGKLSAQQSSGTRNRVSESEKEEREEEKRGRSYGRSVAEIAGEESGEEERRRREEEWSREREKLKVGDSRELWPN